MAALVDWFRLNWGLLTFVTLLAAAFFMLRSSPTPGIDSLESLDQSLTSGQPVVVDFYSNL